TTARPLPSQSARGLGALHNLAETRSGLSPTRQRPGVRPVPCRFPLEHHKRSAMRTTARLLPSQSARGLGALHNLAEIRNGLSPTRQRPGVRPVPCRFPLELHKRPAMQTTARLLPSQSARGLGALHNLAEIRNGL